MGQGGNNDLAVDPWAWVAFGLCVAGLSLAGAGFQDVGLTIAALSATGLVIRSLWISVQ